MKYIKIIAFLLLTVNLFSQNSIDSVLKKTERNNTALSAIRKSIDADKIANKTGLLPSNPEVEFHYLWGEPSVIGTRKDFSVKQSFDFPTAYLHSKNISNLKNKQSELEYQKQKIEILHTARKLCVDLIYQNSLISEYKKRAGNAKKLTEIYKKKFEKGDANILQLNKAKIHLLNISKELESVKIERKELLDRLSGLNGGKYIEFTDSVFNVPELFADFEQWYSKAEKTNPLLLWLKKEVLISQSEKKLQFAKSLPKISGGYMSEEVVGEKFQGVSIGITIPIWEDKNRIKYAKAKTIAVEESHKDAKLQFYNNMKAKYYKAYEFQKSIANYRNQLSQYDTKKLISKALDKGEISLGQYYIELQIYYDSYDKLLQMEYKANKAYSELLKYQ